MQRERRHGKRHSIYKTINNNFRIKLKLLSCYYTIYLKFDRDAIGDVETRT